MVQHQVQGVVDDVADRARAVAGDIKPRLRGWLHAAVAPLAFLSFLVLLVLTDDRRARAGVAVFMVSALLLFGVSAMYHTRPWSEQARVVWKRLDHASIFILIAGSYTPFALLLLEPARAGQALTMVWAGALAGVLFRVFWIGAPRWLYVLLYVVLGWATLIHVPDFTHEAPRPVLVLMLVGGGLYTVGAVVYGLKRPNPSPRWFGFHEVFHSLTIAAFVVHYVGVSIGAFSGLQASP